MLTTTRSSSGVLTANTVLMNTSPATMNVDSTQYRHGMIDVSGSSEDRIDAAASLRTPHGTPAKDGGSLNKPRVAVVVVSASSPHSPTASKTNKKTSPKVARRKETKTTAATTADENDPSRRAAHRTGTSPQQQQQQRHVPPVAVIEQPSSGTDPAALKRPVRLLTARDTDFFLQPTVLSRLILNQKYGRAIQRAFDHAEETCTWLCATHSTTTTNNNNTASPQSLRQLPIHLACSNLGRTSDESTFSLLNELISVLVFAYPDGAHTCDHRNIYPIQEAIWYGVAPETVAIFFMAKPESLLLIDRHGRSLTDINQNRTGKGKEAIQLMIDRGAHFWKVARDEAALRLQHNNNSYPSDNHSISSQSVLASPDADEETIVSIPVSVAASPPSFYQENATPLAWDQLEQRAKITEQLLTAVNEENFHLRQQIETLTNNKTAQHTHTALLKELKRLDRENSVLNQKLYQLEELIKAKCITDDEVENEQFRLAMAEVSSLIDISEQSSLFSGFRASGGGDDSQAPSESQRLYDEAIFMQKQLAKKHNEQREKIRKLRHMVSYTIINDATMGHDHDLDDKDSTSSFADASTISALSHGTARSDASHIIHKKRFNYNEGVVDRLPSEAHLLDDLSKIVWFASARQEQAAKKPGAKVPVQDDLSGILRWAAKKDHRDEFYSNNNETTSVESTWSPIHPKEIWRALPRKLRVMGKSKNKVPPPTTNRSNSKMTIPKLATTTTTTTNTSSRKKVPLNHGESFDSVYA